MGAREPLLGATPPTADPRSQKPKGSATPVSKLNLYHRAGENRGKGSPMGTPIATSQGVLSILELSWEWMP